MDKLTDLKTELKTHSANSYIDSSSISKNGKLFFRNRDLINLSNFDCLSLADSKSIKRAAQEAIENTGFGSVLSRKSAGTKSEHLLAEKALAKFFGFSQALIFSSKNQAFFSILAALLREQDQIICDEDLAGLLSDVSLLLNCNLEVVNLQKISNLDNALQQPIFGKRRFVIADTISQSSARKLDLVSISTCCAKHSAFLIVDESNSAGLTGNRGAGVLEESIISSPALNKPLALISELGLGLACFGAAVCADAEIVEALIRASKTLSLEPAPPACLAAAIRAACDLCELKYLDRTLIDAKLNLLEHRLLNIKQRLSYTKSSFLSIKFNKLSKALEMQNFLFTKGYWVDLMPSPSKFNQSAFIRIFPNINHSDETILAFSEELESFFLRNIV